jgi:hypothetical protein
MEEDTQAKRVKIRISEIIELTNREREINRPDLKDIDFIDDSGKIVNIDEKIVEDFRFCGLSNVDFINTGFYKKGWD